MFTIILFSFLQSITEFLPVSSSGHIFLISKITDVKNSQIDILLYHLGSLFAVMFYMRKDLLSIIKSFLFKKNYHLVTCLIVATVPIVLVGLFFSSYLNLLENYPILLIINMMLWGIFLFFSDRYSKVKQKISKITISNAFIIGLFQTFSLIPGTSRSGSTIIALRYLGFNRTDSARFSFLLSIPTILLASIYAFFQTCTQNIQFPDILEIFSIIVFTFIFSLISISFLIKFVQKCSFAIFSIYRILLGIFILFYIVVQNI